MSVYRVVYRHTGDPEYLSVAGYTEAPDMRAALDKLAALFAYGEYEVRAIEKVDKTRIL